MVFWLFMTVMTLLIPLTMVFFGKRFQNNPPKNINCWYGYRTWRSMKNRDTWVFAHHHLGKSWFRLGLVLAAVSAAGMVMVLGKDLETVAAWGTGLTCAQLVPMILPVFFTEAALKRTFDQHGIRR